MRVRMAVFGVMAMAMGMMSSPAYAQLSGSLGAELELTTACTLSGESETSGVDFGLLDFGTQPATFTGLLEAQAAGTGGNTEILCSADVENVTIAIDGGENGGEGTSIGDGTRALSDGGGSFVPYEVYSTSGTSSPYPVGEPGVSISIATPGEPFVLPIFGRIFKTSPNALAAGSYDDTLQVTITF